MASAQEELKAELITRVKAIYVLLNDEIVQIKAKLEAKCPDVDFTEVFDLLDGLREPIVNIIPDEPVTDPAGPSDPVEPEPDEADYDDDEDDDDDDEDEGEDE